METKKQCFEMVPKFMVICKNPSSKYLVLQNLKTKTLKFYEDQSPIPCDLPFAAERLTNLKMGIPIKFCGIVKFEYNIDRVKVFQAIRTIYYAETTAKEESFDKEINEVFEEEKLSWLTKEEIKKTPGTQNIVDLITQIEKKENICPKDLLENEMDVFCNR